MLTLDTYHWHMPRVGGWDAVLGRSNGYNYFGVRGEFYTLYGAQKIIPLGSDYT